MKKIITKIFFSTLSGKEKVEKYQKIIRENEWNDISKYISKSSSFLDVGCGAGYAMYRAKVDFNCEVNGVDPDPGAHGVGRFIELFAKDKIHITKGFAEKLPFENEKFDVLYCSHVLEHVNDEQQSIVEMNRVLKDSGVAIIGMPSATMAFISLVSQIVFTTHIRIYDFFRQVLIYTSKQIFPFFLPFLFYVKSSIIVFNFINNLFICSFVYLHSSYFC